MCSNEDDFTFLGRVNVVELLIQNGADINIADEHGQTPLHFAAKRGNLCAYSFF